eukprot:78103-Rhodomonas_salina.1
MDPSDGPTKALLEYLEVERGPAKKQASGGFCQLKRPDPGVVAVSQLRVGQRDAFKVDTRMKFNKYLHCNLKAKQPDAQETTITQEHAVFLSAFRN